MKAEIARIGEIAARHPRARHAAPSLLLALAAALALAACGTTPPRTGGGIERTPGSSAPRVATPRGGGYYLDDGPGDHPPANLDAVPDAIPRPEPLQRGALKPYTVMGRNYTPMTAIAPYKARGVASWYGRRYQGKPTSSGEPYDMYAMTAAHPILPIPSYVRVTNLRNGRWVVVRINDRGPFLSDRLIDLSYTAAYKLDVLNGGSARVEVESITPDLYADYATPRVAPAAVAAAAPAPEPSPVAATPAAEDPEAVIAALSAKPSEPAAPAASPPATAPAAAAVSGTGVFLQLGAFGSRENADAYMSRLKAQVDWLGDRLQVLMRDGYYRVHAGPYETPGEARAAAERVLQALGTRPLLVTR